MHFGGDYLPVVPNDCISAVKLKPLTKWQAVEEFSAHFNTRENSVFKGFTQVLSARARTLDSKPKHFLLRDSELSREKCDNRDVCATFLEDI